MAAVPYTDYGAMLLDLEWQLEALPALAVVSALIEAYRLANPVFMSTPTGVSERNEIMKKLTGCFVGTLNNVNAYPLGYETGILFDLSGNPVP